MSLRFAEATEELAAEDARERANGEEEVRLAGSPLPRSTQPTPGADKAVHVQMLLEGLAPGVQDHRDAELGAEPFRILGKRRERCGSRVERERVDQARAALPIRSSAC
jgi:hypothetical protein